MNKLTILSSMSLLVFSSAAFAIDGTISFNGELVSGTCTPRVNGGTANGDATVTLPTLNVSTLSAPQTTAGLTEFTINLKGTDDKSCVVNGKIAKPYFEPEVAKVNSDGRIVNTEADTKDSVDIQLLNNDQAVINLRDKSSVQLSSTASGKPENNEYNYKYYARYFAKTAAKAGKVSGSLSYSIIYK